jgi:hypothetical protein
VKGGENIAARTDCPGKSAVQTLLVGRQNRLAGHIRAGRMIIKPLLHLRPHFQLICVSILLSSLSPHLTKQRQSQAI